MASQTATRQRKGAGAGGPPRSGEGLVEVSNALLSSSAAAVTTKTSSLAVPRGGGNHPVATVKRNKYGTGPFDENWLNKDCCGLFCAVITYMLHMYGAYAVCLILIPPWMSTVDEFGVRTISFMGHLNRTAFCLVAVFAIYAHFKAMTTDPGAVPPDAQPIATIDDEPLKSKSSTNPNDTENGTSTKGVQEGANGDDPLNMMVTPMIPPKRKGKRLCRRCNAFKPKRAHHCSICRRCIIKMDHHCPWVNNCVGIGNHKYFLLFVFYTCLSCVYSLSLVTMRLFDCMHHHGHIRTHHMTCLDRPSQLLNILGLFIEAILFGLFTSCMMIDQAGVVTTKMTHIDRLKGGDDVGNSLAGVVEVFGLNPKRQMDLAEKFRADWLSPFHRICFPSSLQDEIMGFCRPCVSGGGGSKGSSSARSTRMNGDRSETEMTPMIRSVTEIV